MGSNLRVLSSHHNRYLDGNLPTRSPLSTVPRCQWWYFEHLRQFNMSHELLLLYIHKISTFFELCTGHFFCIEVCIHFFKIRYICYMIYKHNVFRLLNFSIVITCGLFNDVDNSSECTVSIQLLIEHKIFNKTRTSSRNLKNIHDWTLVLIEGIHT